MCIRDSSGADGGFTIAALAGRCTLVAIDGEHAPARTADLEIDQAVAGLELTMKPGAVYAGTVVDAEDAPVPHATVHLVDGSTRSRHATTDASGAFEIRGLERTSAIAYAESPAGVSEEALVALASDLRGQKLVLALAVEPDHA